jgi:3-isopropylmalate/(R)-2-methylmalate dehydratase small subunit
VLAIKHLGINVVIAESFSRYFFRNAINNGLPVLARKGITEYVETGDELEVDLSTGRILNVSKDESLQAPPLPDFIIDLISQGGYIPYTKKKLEKEV